MKTRNQIMDEYEYMKNEAKSSHALTAGIWADALAWVLDLGNTEDAQ